MTEAQKLFLRILSAALDGKQGNVRPEEIVWQPRGIEQGVSWQALEQIAREQAVTSLLDDYMLTWEEGNMPAFMQENLQRRMFGNAMMYYRMVNFVSFVLELLKKQAFHGCILKGVGMGRYYPKEELRKTGDVDLYLPVPEEFEAFCALLKRNGFEQEKSITDHHVSFFYISDGIKFELEVHKKPINSQENAEFNDAAADIFAPFQKAGEWKFKEAGVIGGTVPVLPPAQNIFYLLLHMLQHFLSGGMGIRMLCDWVVFWKHAGKETDFSVEAYLSFVRACKIEGFHEMITGLCVSYLGLSMQEVPWMEGHLPGKAAMEIFLKDIFDGGEFGEQDRARMLITLGGTTPVGYLKEFHRQMHLRFQRAGKLPVLWPFLWLATGVMFVYNNRFLRRTSAGSILKSAGERSRLLEEIQLFQK